MRGRFLRLVSRRLRPVVALVMALAMLLTGGVVVAAGSAHAADQPKVDGNQTPSESPTVSERPDGLSAGSTARASGKPVEVTGLRSETGSVFANPDGTFTYSSYGAPKHVLRGKSWLDVDTQLKAGADGRLVPGLIKAELSLSGDGKGAAATLKVGDHSVDLGWTGSLPTPTISGNSVTYANVLPNTDLVQTALVSGVEQSLVLKKRPTTAPTWSIPLKLSTGLKAIHNADNSLSLKSSAGKTVLQSVPAVMYDASGKEAPVATTLVTTAAGTSVAVVPNSAWLTDASTTYPVTIDPSTSIAEINHTYINSGAPTTNYSTDPWLTIGKNTDGSVRRSFIGFNTGPFVGAHVLSATAYAHAVVTGTPSNRVDMYDTGTISSATTWNNPPTIYANWASSTGIGSGNWQSWSATSMMQTLSANKVYKGAIQLRAYDESSTASYKRYDSGQAGTNYPHIDITYNRYPTTPTTSGTSPVGIPHYTNTTTPTLIATGTDPDGGTLQFQYQIFVYGGGPLVAAGSLSSVASGGSARWTVPSSLLTNGTRYGWHVRSYDGTDYSAYSAWDEFTVDTTVPSAPTISSSTHPSGTWTSASTGSFNWTAGPADTAGYVYGLDQPSPNTATTSRSASLTSMTDGTHTLYVRTKDKAGNLSPVARYTFSVGTVALTSPADGDRTQARVTLSGQAPASFPTLIYRYRVGADDSVAFIDVPTGDVVYPGSTTHPSWPLTRSSGAFADLTWNVGATLGANAPDGPVQVEACYGSTCSDYATVQCTRHAFGDSYATSEVGPGTLSLLTGDLAVTAIDVNVSAYNGDLYVGRTATSLAPPSATAGVAGVFGAGWVSDQSGLASGHADQQLTDQTTPSSGYAALVGADGSQLIYLHTGGTSYPFTFTGQGDAGSNGSVLAKTSASRFSLVDTDGTSTVWNLVSGIWQVASVTQAGSNNTSTYTYDHAGRLTRILGAVPDGVECASGMPAGCRALEFNYAANTTASGITLGDCAGLVSSVVLVVGGTTPATSEVARYLYDATGHLRQEWDPRLDNPDGSHILTAYTYDASDRLSTVTSPGVAAWTLTYDSSGRLKTVAQPDPTGPPAKITLAYDVALSGSGLPTVEGSSVATWGQRDLPTTGTAVFPASHAPSATPTSSDWQYSTISYLDVNGREVNTAAYGAGAWQLGTAEYDSGGNVIRELTPGNRAQALNLIEDTDPTVAALTDSASRAQALGTDTVYDHTGTVVTDTYGPTHRVTLNDGTKASGRSHSRIDYDQGAPSGGPYWLATTTGAGLLVDGVDTDFRITVNSYEPRTPGDTATSGWTFHRPTSTTMRMGVNGASSANDIVQRTYYNAAGQEVERRMPSDVSTGTGNGTTLTTYYTAVGAGSCVNPAWAGLVCTVRPAGAPSNGPTTPTRTTTAYNSLLQPTILVETSEATTRTTVNTYDAAGRIASRSVGTSGDSSTPVATTTYAYDSATGQQTGVIRGAATLSTTYDALGRVQTVQDADGSTATYGYDIDGRPATINDGKSTYTYTYDGPSEHRGLLTTLNVGAGTSPSTFTAVYDADGRLTAQTYPSGLSRSSRYNNVGTETSRTYAQSGSVLASFSQATGSSRQIRADTSPGGTHLYTYDPSGRLVSTIDVRHNDTALCAIRTYAYDTDSNRLNLTTYPDDGSDPVNGGCSTATTSTTASHAYDTADRLVDTGYTYDNLGRTLTIPAADAGGTAEINTYYANDRIASQSQASRTRSYILDPQDRIRSWTDDGGSSSAVNHYAADTDIPNWIANADGTWDRNIIGITGDLSALQRSTGAVELLLNNLHGDVVAVIDDSSSVSGLAGYSEADEFGVRYGSPLPSNRYQYLGASQRSAQALGEAILMGARVYQPTLGRFLQVDPVVGGSSNAYEYCQQDPVNCRDLDGRETIAHWIRRYVGKLFSWAYSLRHISNQLRFAFVELGLFKIGFKAGDFWWNYNTDVALRCYSVAQEHFSRGTLALMATGFSITRALNKLAWLRL